MYIDREEKPHVANSPGNGAFLSRRRALIRLALDTYPDVSPAGR